jgi:hypothetical protein
VWQEYSEARAHYIIAIVNSVVCLDRATMSLDNLSGNGKAKPRIVPETLIWPVCIEPFENSFKGVRGNSGAIVVNSDSVPGRVALNIGDVL